MTVEQLLENTTSAELAEWVAYFEMERAREREPEAQDPHSEQEAWLKAFGAFNGEIDRS